VDVDVSSRDSLKCWRGSVTEVAGQGDCHVLLGHIEMGKSREHERVVVLLLCELILQSNNFEALATHVASVDGSLTYKVEHLLVSVRIVFNTGTCTDNDSPRAVRCKD